MEFEPATTIQCPYCGESFTTFVDLSQGDTTYIEDCQVCCQPIEFDVTVQDLENGEFHVEVSAGA
jgi:transcription elongation factor Elf1